MWKGRPDDEFFDQPISHSDHPFLKQYAHADMVRNSRGELVQSSEAKSAERRPGESELDYFDRQYKERVNGLKFRIFWIGFKRKKNIIELFFILAKNWEDVKAKADTGKSIRWRC